MTGRNEAVAQTSCKSFENVTFATILGPNKDRKAHPAGPKIHPKAGERGVKGALCASKATSGNVLARKICP